MSFKSFFIYIFLVFATGEYAFAQYPRTVGGGTLCKGDGNSWTPSLGGNIPSRPGTWSVVQGSGTFSDPNYHDNNLVISNIGFGVNIYDFWENSLGLIEHRLTIYNYNISAGNDTTICNTGGSIQLHGSDPTLVGGGYNGIGTWTVISGTGTFTDDHLFNTNVSGWTVGAINTYQWRFNKDFPWPCTGVANRTAVVNITVNPRPTAALSGTSTICNGQSATLTLNLTGTAPWSVTYTDGVTPVTINNINANPYTFTVSPTATKTYSLTAASDSKCTSIAADLSGSAVVTVNPRPTAVISGTNTICNGLSTNLNIAFTGTALWSITYTDGVTPVTVNNINANPYTFSVSPTVNRTYTLTATSDSKCTSIAADRSGSAVITVNPRPTVVLSGTNTICLGQSTSLSLNFTGTGPWDVTYTDGTTPVTINSINANPYTFPVSPATTKTYTVTAANDSKCTSIAADLTGSAVVTVNPRPTAVLSGTATICNGQSTNLSVALTGTAPWSITYTDGVTPVTINNINASPYSITVSPTSTQTYTLSAASDSKCASIAADLTGSAVVTVNTRPTAVLSGTTTICNGQSAILSVNFTGVAPWGVTYTDGTTPVSVNNINVNPYTFSVSPPSTKTYTLSAASDSKCSSIAADLSGNAVVTVNARPTAVLSGTTTICNGQSATLTATLTGVAPWSITYTDGVAPVTINNINVNPYTFAVSPSSTKTYTLTALNDSKCTSIAADLSGTPVVTVNARPTAVISGTNTICNGQSATLTVNLTGTGPWSITYTDGITPVTINNINTSPYTFSVSPSSTKTYTLTSTTDSKCTSIAADLSGSAVITVNPRPTVVLSGTNTICNGQPTTLTVNLTGSAPWSITYTDGTTPVTINNINASPHSFSVSPSSTQTYTLSAASDSKCAAIAADLSGSAVVTVNPRPTAVLSGTNTICNGQSATLSIAFTGTAPWGITYTDGVTPVTINNINANPYTFTVSPATTKTYTLTAASDSKCAAIAADLSGSAVVTVNTRPTALISGSTTICNGQSATLTATLTGSASWSITYTDGVTPVTINNINASPYTFAVSPSSTKTYTLTATSDSKCAAIGADLSGSALVAVDDRPTAVLSGTTTICNGQSATLTVNFTGVAPWSITYTDGGVPVTINNINANPYTFSVSPAVTKTYSLAAASDSKCTSIAADLSGNPVVTVAPRPTAVISGTNTICNGQPATLTVTLTGGPPWSITYTDGVTPVTINNINASPYSFQVSPAANKTYTLTATSDNRCVAIPADLSGSAVITVNSRPTAVLSGANTICGGQSANLNVTFTGTGPWSITYTDGTTPVTINNINVNPYSFAVSPASTQTYTLTAASDAKCASIAADLSGSALILVNPRPTAALSGTTIICNGQSANLSVAFTGTGPWSVTYTDGITPVTVNNINASPYTLSVSPSSTKTYTLTAASDSKCTSIAADLSGSAVVTVNPRPTAVLSGTTTICSGQSTNLSVTLTGSAPWSITYTDGITPVVINNINANPYSFTVSPTSTKTYTLTSVNDSKCSAVLGDITGSAIVTVNDRPTAVLSGTTSICKGQSATLTVTFTGTAPWSVTYTDGAVPVTVNGIVTGIYSFTVTPASTQTYSLVAASDSKCAALPLDLSGNAIVTINTLPTAVLSGTNTICKGQSATLNINLTGSAPWSITYTDGAVPVTVNNINTSSYSFTVSPVTNKTYTLTAVNDSKCAAAPAGITGNAFITVNPRPTAVLSGTNTICSGQTAALTVAFTGTAPWSITYTDGGMPVTINNINANPYTFNVSPTATATYTLTAASDSKCTSIAADLSGSATVNVNQRPTVALSGTPAICNGQPATLSFTLTGTAPWSVTYTDGVTPVTINNINASPYTVTVSPSVTTTYTLTVANDVKCAAIAADLTGSATVTVDARPTAVLSGSTSICNGQSANLNVTFTGVAPWSITYTDGVTPVTINNINTNPYTFAVSPTSTKTYTLTSVSGNCSAIAGDISGSAIVTVDARPTAVLSGTTAICLGQTATLTVTLTGTAPWSITYTDGTVPVTVNGIMAGVYLLPVAPTTTKTYTLTSVSDNCSALPGDISGNAVVTVNTRPTALISGSSTVCDGQSTTLTVILTGSAPWSITYTDGTIPVTVNNINTSTYTFTVASSTTKTYTLTAVNDSKCSSLPADMTGSAIVTVNARPTAVLSGSNTICYGQSPTLTLNLTGSPPWNITYTDGVAPVAIVNINVSPYTFTVSPSSSRTYSLTALNDSRCMAQAADLSGTAAITVNPRPTAVISGNASICNGQSATVAVNLTGSAPWSITYTDGVTPVTVNNINASPYTFTVSPTATKTYTVTALSDAKCTALPADMTGSATVTVNARPTVTLTGGSTCVGQSAALTLALTGAAPWSVTYTDGITPVTVNNINASPYTISVSPVSDQTYVLTAANDSRCSSIAADMISNGAVTVNTRPTASISGTATICNGQSASITLTFTGAAPWSATYTDGITPVTINGINTNTYTFSVSPNVSRTYTLVTVSDSKCTSVPADLSGSAAITVNPRPTAALTGTTTVCNGQSTLLSISFSGSAPWSVTYTDGTTPVTVNNILASPYTFTVTPTTSKTYTLLAANDSKCAATVADLNSNAVITVNPRPTVSLSGTNAICYGQSATLTLTLTGTAPWNVTYTDGATPVVLTVNASPYTFTVSPGVNTTYTLTSASDSKCNALPVDISGSAVITVNARPTAVLSGTTTICNGQSATLNLALTGTAPWSVTYTDGIAPVTINNINASPYTFTVAPGSTKTYALVAVNDSKCTALAADLSGNAVVTVNARPTGILSGSTTICNGQSATLSVALTGTAPWNITYTDGIAPVTINNINASPYTFTVSPTTTHTYALTAVNDNNCSAIAGDLSGSAIVTVNPRPTVVMSGTTSVCDGNAATITLTFTGNAPWNVVYTDGTTPVTVNNINANPYTFAVLPASTKTYTVTSLTDSKCTAIPADITGNAVVTVNPRPTAVLSGTTTICNSQSATLTVVLTGTAPWSITYTDGVASTTINGILTSTYTFAVTPGSTKTYTLTAVNDSKCSSLPGDMIGSAVVTVNPRPTVVLSGTNTICFGQSATLDLVLTGTAPWSVTYTDGVTPVTLTVNASPYTFSVSPGATKTYTLTAASDSKCSSIAADLTGAAVVTVNPHPTVALTGTTSICEGQSATLMLTMTGTAPWNVTYTDGTAPVTINNIVANPYTFSVAPTSNKTYTLTAANDSKCTSSGADLTSNAVVSVNTRPTAVLSGTAAICNGQSATLSTTLTGAAPWSITYTDGITPVTINNINASPFTFPVSPTTTKTYTLASVSDSRCNAVPGDVSGSAVITVNARPTASLSGTTAICNGQSATLTLAFTGSAPWNVVYTDGTTPVTVNNINTNTYTFTVSPASTKTYTIASLTDSKCSAIPADLSGSATVTVNPRPTVALSGTTAICNGQSALLTLTLTGTAPWSVTYTDGIAPVTVNNILTSTYTISVSPTSSKTYTLTSANDSKCTSLPADLTGNAVITVNPRPTAVLSGTNSICYGQSASLTLVLTGTGPWSATYTDGTTPVTINNINVSPYTFAVTPGTNTTYSLVAVSDSKCAALPADMSGSATITVSLRPTAAISGTATVCNGQPATLIINLTGTAPWSVSYTDGITPVTINNINANPYTFTVSPVSNTTYTLTAASDSKCSSLPPDLTGSASVTVNTRPTAVLSGTTTILNGQSATLNVTFTGTGPWNLIYTDGITPVTLTNINTSNYAFTVSPSTTKTYTLVGVSDSKCTAIPADLSGSAVVTVNSRPTAVFSGTTTICNGQSATLTINFTGTGPWNVTYTDGTVPVTVNGIVANPYNIIVSPVTDKTYTVTALSDTKGSALPTDINGTPVVTVNPRPTGVISGTTTICNGQPATITINLTGTAPWNITYTDGVLPVTVNNINTSTYSFVTSPTSNKTYILTAVSDSKCAALPGDITGSAMITVNTRPTVALNGGSTICNGQTTMLTLTLTGAAPWNVTYTDGATPVTINNINSSPYTFFVSPASTKTYTLLAANDSRCATLPADLSGSAVVTVNPRPTASISGTSTICNGQSTTLTLALTGSGPWDVIYTDGITPVTISGINASVYTFSVTPATTRTYTITTLNDSKCSALSGDISGSAVVTVNTRPTAVLSGTTLICAGQPATLTLNLTGSAPWNVTYTDGVTPVTINNINTNPYTFNVLPTSTKTYTLTALNDNKCSSLPADLSGGAVVNVNPRPTVALSGSATICNGQSATLTLNLTGTAPWNVTYTDGTTPITISNINFSPYTFTVSPATTSTYTVSSASDSKCNAALTDLSGNATITVNTRPTAALSGTTTICNGQSATLTLNLTGTAPWNVTYTDGTLPITINNINSNTYTFPVSPGSNTTYTLTAVTDSKCSAITAGMTGSAIVTVNSRPTSSISNDASICRGDSAQINIALTGTGPWNLTYSNGTSTTVTSASSPYSFKVSPANTKTYVVTTLSDLNCSAQTADMTGSATITIKPLPNVYAVTGGGTFCEGGTGTPVGLSNSTVTINYELYLDNATTGQIVAGTNAAITFGNQAIAGTYTIKATSIVNACQASMNGSATVIKNPLPSDAQVISGPALVCPGSSNNYTVPAIANATSYTWALPANTSITSGAGTDSITVLFAPIATSGTITVRGSNGCGDGGLSTFPVTVKPLPGTATAIGGKNKVCQGEKNVVYSTSLSDATSYTWTVPSGASIISGQGTTQIIVDYGSGANSGDITVKGNNSCGSGSTFSQAITVVPTPQLTINAPSGEITCSTTSVTVSASSATGGVNYSWMAINGGNITAGAGASSATVNAAGGYIVTVTEPVNSCKASDTVIVISNHQAPQNVNIISFNSGIIDCNITRDTLTASTSSGFPVGYVWTASLGGNITSGGNTAKAVVDKEGLYEVKVIDLLTGCYATKNISIIEQKTPPDISVVNPETEKLTCSITTVTLSGSSTTSGVSYSWSSTGVVSGGNTAMPVVNATGVYTLTVTAPNGCKSVASTIVSADNTLPNVSINTTPDQLTCSASSVSLYGYSTDVGATLLWTGPGIVSGATTQTPQVNKTGTYTLTVTHPISGCTSDTTVVVSELKTKPKVIIANAPRVITCSNTSLAIDGNSSTGINPVWTASQGGNILSGKYSKIATVNAKGAYTLTMTHATTGCTHDTTVLVTVSDSLPKLTVDPFPLDITCGRPTVTLSGQPLQTGTIFTWAASPGNIVSGETTNNPIVNQAGTYILTVTDTITGCIATAAIEVKENKTVPQLVIATPGKFTCTINEVQLNASSTNANVSYAWSTVGTGSIKPGYTNVSNPIVLTQGTYTVTVTDLTNQCSTIGSTTVTEDKILPNISVNKNPAQFTCTVGQVILSGNSLTTGVTYEWTTSGTGNIANGTTTNPSVDNIGYYKLKVTNLANGCSISDSVRVTKNDTLPNIWVNTHPDTLNCIRDSVKLSGNSSTANVTYAWRGVGNISDPSVKEPYVDAPGTYYLTVTSSVNGCKSTLPVEVAENKIIPAAPIATVVSACYGAPASTLTATGNNIKWYSDASKDPSVLIHTGNTFTPTTASAVGSYTYFATQTDPYNHCQSPVTQVTYNVFPLPAPPINIDNAVCQGLPNTSVQATGWNIKWYDAPGGNLLAGGNSYTPPSSVTAPGTYVYFATQTDGNSCQSLTKEVNFTVHANPSKPLVDKLTASICQGASPNPSFIASGTDIKWYASSSLPSPIQTGNNFTSLESVSGIYNYYVTQTSGFGCVSPYETVVFTIKALPQKYTVTGGGVYCENLNGLNIGLSGSEVTATYQLILNGTTIISSLSGTGTALDFGLQKLPGNYTITGTSNNGCSVSMTGGVSIVSSPLPLPAGHVNGASNVCQGATSVVYTVDPVTNATSYIWSVPSGAVITSGMNSNTIYVDYTNTAVSGPIHVTGVNNCGNGLVSSDLQVVVGQLPDTASNIKYAPVNNVICLGDSDVIYEVDPIANATGYEWILPAGASIQWGSNTRQIRVRFAPNSAVGAQTIKVRGKNSCGTSRWSAPYAITVSSNPVVYAGIDQNLCSTGATLQGSAVPSGGTGTWSIISGSVIIANNSQNNSTISSVAQGTNILTWTVTANGCRSKDTVKIINNQVYVDAGQNLPICDPEITLKGSSLPAGTTGLWSVTSGFASLVNASLPGTKASNFGYGNNILYWKVTKNGCISQDSVIITNYRPTTPDAGPDQALCAGNSVLSGNLPIHGTGQWSVYSGLATITNPSSPTSTVTSIGKGKNILLWTITNQICSLSDTMFITNNAIDVNAGYDQLLCDNRTTLDATPPPLGATGLWSVLQGSASFLDGRIYNTKVAGLVNGNNKLIWSISKGTCVNTDTVILVCNMPTNANAGADQFLGGSSTIMDGNQPTVGSGKWSIISGAATFANDTVYNTSASGLNPGSNTLRWTITYKGCSSFDDVIITNGTVEKVDAGQDQILCTDNTYMEAVKPTYGFGVWTVQKGSANFANNEAYNTQVTGLAPGTNVLRWSVVVSGIEFYDTVVVVNNTPTTAIVGPTQVLCGDSSALTGNYPIQGTGKWTLEGGSAVINDVNQSNSKVTKLNNGDNMFRWTITKGTCVSSQLLVITNDKPSVADAGLDQTICEDKTTLIPNAPTIGTGEWSVLSGSGRFINNEVSGLASGLNTLRWTIHKNNCSSHDEVNIISHKPTTASAGVSTVVCVDSVFLAANKPNASLGEFGRWSLQNGSGIIADTTLNTSLVKRLAPGKSVLRWTINNTGCISSAEVEINYAFIQSVAGSSIITCDDHVILNANNPGIGAGEWSIIGGSGSAVFVSPSSPNTEVKNLDKGKNILRWSIRNQTCVSSSEVSITNNSPSDAFAGGDQNLCTNTYTLDAKPVLIGTGSWSVLSGSGNFVDTTAYNSAVTNIGAGVNTYRWTVTNWNCISTDEVVISNNKPIKTSAGLNQTLCADSASLTANQPVLGVGAWSITQGGGLFKDAFNPYTKITKLANDTNILRWTVTNKNCAEYSEIKIVNNLPTIASAGADVTACSDQITLDGNIPRYGVGEWSVLSGSGKFLNKNLFNTIVQGLTRGKNMLRWKITKQTCISYDDVIINDDLPTQPDAGTGIAVCDNNTPLNGNKPLIGKGYWSVISGKGTFIDSSRYNTTIVGLGQGSNVLRWTITNNRCSIFDVVEVKNNQTDVYAGPDQIVFEDHSLLVGNEPPRGIGTWSLDAGAGTIASPNNFESGVTGLGEGANTFIWAVNIDGCISSDRVVVNYYRLPTASFSVNQTDGCPPMTVNFTKTTVENYPFKWDFGYSDSTSLKENPIFTYSKPGTYTAQLTVTGPDGKQVTKSKVITVHEVPTVKFEIVPREIYIPEQELRCFNYSQGGNTFQWKFGDGGTSTDLNPVHTYTDSGFYTVSLKVISEYQCTDSLVIENGIHVMEKSRMRFPTGFTPNPNGSSNGRYDRLDYSNDVFYPIILVGGLKEYKMEVYNRWGVLLFESNSIDIGWDGYYKGKLLMQDVYIYRISGIYNDGKRFSVTGDVLLMRR
jgi:gliding motility-associated-like protein